MAYDKPKVTIDLEEYTDLKKQSDAFTFDEYVLNARITIAALLNNQMNIGRTHDVLSREGIRFSVMKPHMSTRIDLCWEDILIEKIDKK